VPPEIATSSARAASAAGNGRTSGGGGFSIRRTSGSIIRSSIRRIVEDARPGVEVLAM
jgi:hypothetical protein